jgi:hypothetical protein
MKSEDEYRLEVLEALKAGPLTVGPWGAKIESGPCAVYPNSRVVISKNGYKQDECSTEYTDGHFYSELHWTLRLDVKNPAPLVTFIKAADLYCNFKVARAGSGSLDDKRLIGIIGEKARETLEYWEKP